MTANIRAAADARMVIINARSASNATKILNNATGQIAVQNIDATMKVLNQTQSLLNFTDPKTSLISYYFYQKINSLSETTNNTLLVGELNRAAFLTLG
jgi:hypothetical protein